MNIEYIEEQLKIGQVSPHELAQMAGFLASAYSHYYGELGDILGTKPKVWNEIRLKTSSDKGADRQWDATEMGLAETRCRVTIKRSEKLLSSVKSLIKVAEGEARNQF